MLYLYNVYHVMKVYHFSITVEEHIMMFYPLDISLYFFSNCFFSSVCTFLERGGGSRHPFHFLISIIFYIKNSLSLSPLSLSHSSLYISLCLPPTCFLYPSIYQSPPCHHIYTLFLSLTPFIFSLCLSPTHSLSPF